MTHEIDVCTYDIRMLKNIKIIDTKIIHAICIGQRKVGAGELETSIYKYKDKVPQICNVMQS